jgi:Mycotoxin biosynthesis protein UstYa
MTEDEAIREELHMDHCLEYWREQAMCRGDVTLSTFEWLEGLPFSRVYSDHQCVNWKKLDNWARGRMVNTFDLTILEGYDQARKENKQSGNSGLHHHSGAK